MAQTIGERNSVNRARVEWADLRDSSAEDLLDSQPSVPPAFLHQDSYVDTPEPSFDDTQGSVLGRLGRATALDAEELMDTRPATSQLNASAAEFIPTSMQPDARYLGGSGPIGPAMHAQPAAPGATPSTSSTERHPFLRQSSFLKRAAPSMVTRGSALRGKRQRSGTLDMQDATGAASSDAGNGIAGTSDAGSGTAATDASMGVAQNAPDALPAGGVNDEDWERRNEKRLNVVRGIRSTLEYETMSRLRAQEQLGAAAPITPDPNNRQISKRKWESEVMHWRNALRQFTAATLTEAPSPERIVLLPTLDD